MVKKKKKRIIDKIVKNVAITKNKKNSQQKRESAHNELKRLNRLKEPGNIVKRSNREMWGKNPKTDKTYEHNYLISEVDKKNNVKVNLITHSKIRPRKSIKSLSTEDKKSYLIKKQKEVDFKKRKLKFYDFNETPINKRVPNSEKKALLKSVDEYNKRSKK